MDEITKTTLTERAHERIVTALRELTETIRGSDYDTPVSSVFHLVEDAENALDGLDALSEPVDPDELDEAAEDAAEDSDTPEPCELCAGEGFGADDQGAVACPQCNGLGVQPEGLASIEDDFFPDPY